MDRELDVVIVGGGLVGLSFARALADSGLTLGLLDAAPAPAAPDAAAAPGNRVYAISPGSAAYLESCGAWTRVPAERVTRVESMQIHGDEPDARLEFSAYEAGLPALAWIVENDWLHWALYDAMAQQEIIVRRPAEWSGISFSGRRAALVLRDGETWRGRLIAAADGADSRVRGAAGIATREHDYRQLGLVANLRCERPHRHVAFQWFMPDGVLAFLPMPGQAVSMVWSVAEHRGRELLALAPERLAGEIEQASRAALGAVSPVTAVAAFPLRLLRVDAFTREGLALIGDAAHSVHPLAGQGVNLGFRDARALAGALAQRASHEACGDAALLRRYERARKEDVAAVQLVTDGLQKLFGYDNVWARRARNRGLGLVNGQALLKNFLVRHAVS